MCVRVLQVGAHEDLMMNYYRNFSGNRVKFDWVLRRGGRAFRYRDDSAFDGQLFEITPLSKSRWRWMRELRSLVVSGKYTHVHLHAGWSNALALIALIGVSVTQISHAHSQYPESKLAVRVRNAVARAIIRRLSQVRLACSSDAGRQMFGSQFSVLPNVIEYERFRPSEDERTAARFELGFAQSDFVIGHVGQFIPVKNHLFLLEILAHLEASGMPTYLLLVGSGDETRTQVMKRAEDLGVRERVIVAGEVRDVWRLLNAMDVFVFPSLFEGFGMALLEAQVSGLVCIYSDVIPNAAVVSEGAIPLALEAGVDEWAHQVWAVWTADESYGQRVRRSLASSVAYNAADCASKLQTIYEETVLD